MDWIRAVEHVRETRQPAVLVTVTTVRGHAPREAGAKMVVTADSVHGTIGGGNLEESAVGAARKLLAEASPAAYPHGVGPSHETYRLTDKADNVHGQQCCGGEVEVLFEPLGVRPAVAVFGMGHVGLELARILARHDLDLHVVDSRADQLTSARLAPLGDAIARVHVHHARVPEVVLGEVPTGTHVVILTHDHAEDAALVDMALRCGHLSSIGLIGSSAKWRRFQKTLAAEGHSPEAIARVRTPIGIAALAGSGKQPEVIALSVAAELVTLFTTPATPSTPSTLGAAHDTTEAHR